MILPKNGRIAIIDDNIQQALPLINALAKNQCPYVYFSGEVKYLPSQEENTNDIRVLFLDINLIDDAVHSDKELKSKLIPVISRVIAKDNYPYILIYWSRNEREYADLIKGIFDNELSDRKPIKYLSHNKLNYFTLEGEKNEEFENNLLKLFVEVENAIKSEPSYCYLLNWENQVHKSADFTLQKVFSAHNSFAAWTNNSNFLITKFGKSYSGKYYGKQTPEDKIKSCFQAFNNVFMDSLGYSSANEKIEDCIELEYNEDEIDKQSIFSINKNLLISDEKGPDEYSGAITEDSNPLSDKVFNELLNNSVSRSEIIRQVEESLNGKEILKKDFDKAVNKLMSEVRGQIRESWKKVYCVVTPLCDYIQEKYANSRIVKGMIIESKHKIYIDDKSEAIFISPQFKFSDKNCVLILHYRYFFTISKSVKVKHLHPLFRIRLQLLSEIQSKLARHINRQGILFLD